MPSPSFRNEFLFKEKSFPTEKLLEMVQHAGFDLKRRGKSGNSSDLTLSSFMNSISSLIQGLKSYIIGSAF